MRTMTCSVCPECGGPLFANPVRRFDERITAIGRAAHHQETPERTAYQDGRECRKCRTFFPFDVKEAATV